MTTHQIFVKSIVCGSCMVTVKTALLTMDGVTAVDIFAEENKVCVSGEALSREEIIARLASIGYHDKENAGLFSRANTFDHWYCYSCASCDS